jgi:hypothetical protein
MNEVEKNIWKWIYEYVEINNEFYDYKFPPCPYAKSARLNGLVDVVAYTKGRPYQFITSQIDNLITHKMYSIRIMAFPLRMRWYFHLHILLNRLNKSLVTQDLYVQYGKTDDYFIVIVNKLSDVLDGHRALSKTDYYKNWSKDHYKAVVERRETLHRKNQ